MSTNNPIIEHFGTEGLRRFPAVALQGSHVPEGATRTLREQGIPVAVGPYFRAASSGDAAQLGAFASRQQLQAPPGPLSRWLRLGTDGGADLCVRPDGAVQAVFLSEVLPDMYVSASVDLFSEALVLLDRAVSRIAVADGLQGAVPVLHSLMTGLQELDPLAFAERESWWPRVLDDVRHTLNFPFSASFEFELAGGRKEVVTDSTGIGRLHPEERIWQRLSSSGVRPEQVTRVYCELEPCFMPGHYCAVWMQHTFPRAQFTHSFGYGASAESREEGLKEAIIFAARQARRRQG
ncbi:MULTISPECIES: SUKH-4 family immunity protein [Streptomyces]|uniref:SUKH-4 family immunity protein n=1 Tax=Streptomyces pratisoli TaxID=3139917 RepID=A0ACC6QRI3_9ACTN|nr:SUKH-4 family immunity protein [Streptomyces sp. NBC_00259]